MTLKAMGRVLLALQCVGKAEQRNPGEPVLTSSPGCSANISFTYIIERIKAIVVISYTIAYIHKIISIVAQFERL